MKKNLGYLAASFLGSAIAIGVMMKIDNNDQNKQLENGHHDQKIGLMIKTHN